MVDWFSGVPLVDSDGGWRLARVGCRLVATAPHICVARFTLAGVDGPGAGGVRYWCWVSQFNRLCVFDWRRVNVLLRASG